MAKAMSTRSARFLVAAAALFAANPLANAALSFNVGGAWPNDTHRTAAVNALTSAVNRYNAYGDFGNYNVYAYYNSGIPTAQANYLGSIGYGGTYPNERVTLHEMSHYLGTGTYGDPWDGARGEAIIDQFDGIEAILQGDSAHYWPYGLNQDAEGAEINRQRHVALLYAMRIDMGIGSTANPTAWAATNVTLTDNDAINESGFNFTSKWSDATFAHPNADYSTGNFTLRTPASGNSFTFAGKSLTVNNAGNAGNGLFFKGSSSAAVITIRDLNLNGGTFHNFTSNAATFQLAGNINVVGASTIHSEQGGTNITAAISGSAPLTIGTTNAYVVKFSSPANTFTGDLTVVGRFELAAGATHRFAIGDAGLTNVIKGPSAVQVSLNGLFDLDLSNASDDLGDSWTLVTAANAAYGTTFGVAGFFKSGGQWLNDSGYAFSTATGKLSYIAAKTTWTGDASANLSDASSWDADAPVTGNIVRFGPAGASGATLVDDHLTPASHALTAIVFDADASAYTLNPADAAVNGFRLTGAITNNSPNLQTINETIQLAGLQSRITTSAGGGDIVLTAPLTGTGGVAKRGLGTLTLSAANTYAGGTRVDGGTLRVTGSLAAGGTLGVGGGTFSYNGAASHAFAATAVDAGASTIRNDNPAATLAIGSIGRTTGGTVDFVRNGPVTTTAANVNGILGPWAFTGSGNATAYATNAAGAVVPYTGATAASVNGTFGGIPSGDTSGVNYHITPSATFAAMGLPRNVNTLRYSGPGGTQTVNNGGATLTLNGFLLTGTGPLAFDGGVIAGASREIVVNAASSDLTLNGPVQNNASGPSALTKVGPNALTLVAANGYSGGTRLSAGTLRVGGTSALGSGTLALEGGTLTSTTAGGTNEPTVSNAVVVTGGAIAAGPGTLFRVNGGLSGNGAVALSGTFSSASLRLAGDNAAYAGTATVTGANVRLGSPAAGSAAASWTVNGGLQTDVVGNATFHLGSLGGTGTISGHAVNPVAATHVLSVGALDADSTFSGAIVNNATNTAATGNADGAQNNVLALTKVGSGTLTLTGPNAYGGTTTINEGTLVIGNAAQTPILSGAGADLRGGTLVFDYAGGPSPADDVRDALAAGYSATPTFSVGRLRATNLVGDRVLGWTDIAGLITITQTVPGDANLDLAVNFDDLLTLAQNYGSTGGKTWGQGDSNYDGGVDFDDLLALAQRYGSSLSLTAGFSDSFATDWALARSLVPEPTALCLLAAPLLRPRRRR